MLIHLTLRYLPQTETLTHVTYHVGESLCTEQCSSKWGYLKKIQFSPRPPLGVQRGPGILGSVVTTYYVQKREKVAGETSERLDHHGTLGHYHKRHSRGGEAIFKLSPSPCFTGQGQDALPDGRGTGGQERTAQRRPDADVGTPRGPLRWDANVLSSAKERLNTLLLRSQDWGGVSLTLFKVYENIWMCKCHWLCASNRLWLYEKSVF